MMNVSLGSLAVKNHIWDTWITPRIVYKKFQYHPVFLDNVQQTPIKVEREQEKEDSSVPPVALTLNE